MKQGKRKRRILILIALLLAILAGSFACVRVRYTGNDKNTVTIFLVRHGQTEANTQGLLVGGGGDSPLTEEGKAGVQATGQALKDVRFSRAYSSPLGRAVTTRDLILSENDHSNQPKRLTKENLKDIRWGKAEGMSADDATAEFGELTPENTFGSVDDKNFVSPIGAESKYHFYQRFDKAMEQIGTDQRNVDQNVLVVAHSSAGYWLSEVFHKEDYSAISNASVTILQCQDGKWKMIDFNDLDQAHIKKCIDQM